MENPASSCRGKCRPGCSSRVRRNEHTRARTYRVGPDGYGVGVGWIAMMGCASGDDEYTACDDGHESEKFVRRRIRKLKKFGR